MIGRISVFLPDLRSGGVERVCLNLANAFASKGIAVDVVLMRKQGELLELLDPRINVVDLGAPRPRHVLLPLMRYLRAAQPQAVLANMWPLTILAALARLLSQVRCRLAAVEHTTWSASRLAQRGRTRMMIKTTMRLLLPKADAVAAVSQGAARDLERFAGLKPGSVLTLYNPVTGTRKQVDVPTELPPAAAQWADGDHKRVLAVGTLKAVKDFPTLIRAFALLHNQVNVRLLILGEGEERPKLEALIQSLGLQDAVSLPGFAANTAPFYAHADVFVLSSVNEGLPTVMIEALEQGVPVVSTDCPSGPREILEGGKYGKLMPVGNAEALAAAMLGSLQSSHDPAALKARAQDFSVDRIADQYLDLLLPDWREQAAA